MPIFPPRTKASERPTVVAAAVLLVLALFCGAVAYVNWPVPGADRLTASGAPFAASPAVAAAPPADPSRAANNRPSFDVVRVGPQGRVVVAGRAEGGAEVTVRDGERVLGQTRANDQGLFVLVPDQTLSPGPRELTLSARRADGTETKSADSVFLLVPEPAQTAASTGPAVAVLLPPPGEAAPRLLDATAPRSRKLGLDTVDYDERGSIRFAGSARPDTPIRLYVDNEPVGDARADAGGQWVLTPSAPVSPGVHRLRVDQIGPDGKVVARVELPFQRTAVADTPATGSRDRAIVQPGQNLWRIARQSYGQGTRYTVIYSANRDQIRDPNRIYPGQIFAVPPRF